MHRTFPASKSARLKRPWSGGPVVCRAMWIFCRRRSRNAVSLHDVLVRFIAEPRPLRHLDTAGRIGIDAAAPEARGALHVEDFDEVVVTERHELQRRQKARPEIGRMRNKLDAQLIGESGDLQKFGNAADL